MPNKKVITTIVVVLSIVFLGACLYFSIVYRIRGNNARVCEVTFDYNDGSGRVEIINVPKGETIENYAPYLIDETQEIIAWSSVVDGERFVSPISEDIRLFAIWSDFSSEIVTYTSYVPDILTDRFIIIQPQDDNVLYGKIISVANSVKFIKFCSENIRHDDFSLIINSRVDGINVTFDNFNFSSYYFCAFDASNVQGCVNLNLIGENSIRCSEVNENWNKGADCIRAKELKICGEGWLSLYAGKGIDGEDRSTAGDGKNGERGGNGQDGGCGIITDKLTIDGSSLEIVAGNGGNGGKGGNGNNTNGLTTSGKHRTGGNGGSGGNGGHAIDTLEFFATNANLGLMAGNGGNGGNGGKGGGDSQTFGGRGGVGGNGGRGGNVFSNVVKSSNILNGIRYFMFGTGGEAGKGGSSANSSLHGVAGVTGLPGKVNCE